MLKRTDESGQSPVLDSTGQSLVEVLVVLALSTVVMVALIIVIVVGLKNAQFAQNQARETLPAYLPNLFINKGSQIIS